MPGISRIDQNELARAQTEFAAHRERAERELDRLQRIREELRPVPVLRARVRDALRALTSRELAFLGRSLGRTVDELATVFNINVFATF